MNVVYNKMPSIVLDSEIDVPMHEVFGQVTQKSNIYTPKSYSK